MDIQNKFHCMYMLSVTDQSYFDLIFKKNIKVLDN